MLVAARDSAAQSASFMVQAIPLVTSARPTAGKRNLTEGYVTQPVLMTQASWAGFTGIGTLNFEGLTLERGELNTGGYGEGFVDRRHPHSYVHELLVGREQQFNNEWSASVFAGRGFAPFGSDDPMVRPLEKYPVNHHLAQVLERVVAIAAVRYGPVIGELGTFNGDEPLGPGAPPNLSRFGDSWSSRLTILPLSSLELSGSLANVKSPEVRSGGGLDQVKQSLVARYAHGDGASTEYALAEWAHTNERDRGETITRLGTLLAEGSVCRRGVIAAGRIERTDRPEEEQTLDPFRTPRPSADLSNLGVSRWTTLTASLAAPRVSARWLTGRPFVEVASITAGRGDPGGLFDPELRYGTSHLWMLSAGVRLSVGAMHGRMGRYGAALPSDEMGMSAMQDMPGMNDHRMTMANAVCEE